MKAQSMLLALVLGAVLGGCATKLPGTVTPQASPVPGKAAHYTSQGLSPAASESETPEGAPEASDPAGGPDQQNGPDLQQDGEFQN